MRPILWEGWILDYYDALAYLKGEKEWAKVKGRKIKFLVDTRALRTIIPKRLINGIEPLHIRRVKAQGVCDKPAEFLLSHLGIALKVDNERVVSIHGVLVPLDDKVETKISEVLRAHNADAILGLISMNELHVTIDEKPENPSYYH